MHHGLRKLLQLLVVTNQCPYCRNKFMSRDILKDHATRSLGKGECRVDQSIYFTSVQELECSVCLYCNTEYDMIDELQSELAQ